MKKKLTKEVLDKIAKDPDFPHQVDREQLQKLAEYGHTDEYMAGFFGVSTSTWDKWKRLYPEFYKCLQFWKQFADEEVERALFERAKGYEIVEEKTFCYEGNIITHNVVKHFPPDVKAIAKWLSCRKPDEWTQTDKLKLEADGDFADKLIKARLRVREQIIAAQQADSEEVIDDGGLLE
jgi:hypothetical protein